MDFNREKFKKLVHYICHKADKKELGSTKLNKILWYADSISYLHNGESLTGETYRKQEFGPVPQHILPILEELEECNYVTREKSEFYNYTKTDYDCLQAPDISDIDDSEVIFINQLIDIICKKHTAVSISESTHGWIWDIAELGEEIPLYASYVAKTKEPSEAAIDWARSAIESQQAG